MAEKKQKKSLSFDSLTNSTELITYLNSGARLSNSKFLYQYTSISALVSMLHSKTMHLSNAKYMNDQLEYQNGDKAIWDNLFFSCFMMEEEESIGMWSMYAQPWSDGVKISIPKDILRQWVTETKELMEISQETKQPTGRTISNTDKFKIWISAVAYSNLDRVDRKSDEEILRCGGQENRILHNAPHYSELTGYIKDIAWLYEKEIRVKSQFDNWMGFERVAIKMPDYVIESLIITPSPLFEGDFATRIKDEIAYQLKTNRSKFVGKLKIRNVCDNCSIKHSI